MVVGEPAQFRAIAPGREDGGELNAVSSSTEDPNNRYSGANIAWIVVRTIFLILALIGTFFPTT